MIQEIKTEQTFYEITYNSDSIEGKGSRCSTGIYFLNENDAIEFVESYRYASKFGIMGQPGNKYNITKVDFKIKIYESLKEYDELNPSKETLERIKNEAMNKLTEIEKKVLGLK